MSTLFSKNLQKFRNLVKQRPAVSLKHTAGMILLSKNLKRPEAQPVSRYQFEIHAIPNALHGKAVTGTVQVTIEAATHLILFQQSQDLRAFITLVSGWIVQKYHLLLLPCRFLLCF